MKLNRIGLTASFYVWGLGVHKAALTLAGRLPRRPTIVVVPLFWGITGASLVLSLPLYTAAYLIHRRTAVIISNVVEAVRAKASAALLGICCLLALSCAPKSPPSLQVEGQIAFRGRQVLAAIRGAGDAVDQLIVAGVLPRATGVQVLEGLRLATVEAERLGAVLLEVDLARDATARASALARARRLVLSVNSLIGDADDAIPIADAVTRGQVKAVLRAVSEALFSLMTLFPPELTAARGQSQSERMLDAVKLEIEASRGGGEQQRDKRHAERSNGRILKRHGDLLCPA